VAGGCRVGVVYGDEVLLYSFPEPHPFRSDRVENFYRRLPELEAEFPEQIVRVPPRRASEEEVLLYHDREYVEFVKKQCEEGYGYLDYGDTPAFKGCYEASLYVVGSTLRLVEMVLKGEIEHGFNPVGGLHHARRSKAAGFCIFNDAGTAIQYLLDKAGLNTILYVDIDAHHGDGVFYDFYYDKRVIIVDFHQDGRTLYPGTGFSYERGGGEAEGTKLNIPLMPGAGTRELIEAWESMVEGFIEKFSPEFVLIQAGADGMQGDPLTGLEYTEEVHRYVVSRLHRYAEEKCEGRIVAMGGGGYNRANIVKAWSEVVRALATPP